MLYTLLTSKNLPIIFIVVLSLCMICFLILLYIQLKRISRQLDTRTQDDTLVEDTNAKVKQIILMAQSQAQQLFSDTTALKKTMHEKLLIAYEEMMHQSKSQAEDKVKLFEESVHKDLVEAAKEHIEIFQKVQKDIETYAQENTNRLLKEMEERIISLGNERGEFMEKELASIRTDLDTYKKEQLAKIESNIYEILARTSEAVLGQAVNLDTHQELVVKALEQAKREGVFV